MDRITSRTNPEITHVALLIKSRKERHACGLFVAEGLRTVSTLLDAGVVLKRLYLLESLPLETIQELHALCIKRGYTLEVVITPITTQVLDKISDTTSPSGIVAVFQIPKSAQGSLNNGLVLADITSPGNMGTIIRTAAALSKKVVVVVSGTDVWSPKVVQASAGTVGSIPIVECSWEELLMRKKDTQLWALVVDGGENPAPMSQNNALLVVGNEAHGLPDAWVADCEKKITLPMPGNTESLNAALAVSIVMYLGYLRH